LTRTHASHVVIRSDAPATFVREKSNELNGPFQRSIKPTGSQTTTAEN
jgi:hypothetical protein